MFRIPGFFARIYSRWSFYVLLTRGGSVGTRREKQLFPSLSPSCLVTFWLVFESSIWLKISVFLVWTQPSAESYRRAAEGLTGNLNARCFIGSKAWRMQREVRFLSLSTVVTPDFRAFFLRGNRPRNASAHWAAAWKLAQSAPPAWRGCPVLGISRLPQLMNHPHSARVGDAASIRDSLCGRGKGLQDIRALILKRPVF